MEQDLTKVDDPSQREEKIRHLSNITQFRKSSSFNIRPILETIRFRKSSNLKIVQYKNVQFRKVSNFEHRPNSITVQFRKLSNFKNHLNSKKSPVNIQLKSRTYPIEVITTIRSKNKTVVHNRPVNVA